MKISSLGKRLITVAAAVLLLVCLLPGSPAAAREEIPAVKVGYYILDGFQMMDEATGQKSGYGYEYLQKVARYGGFRYEYVYGTYPELVEKVQNGEIDIMLYCYTDNMDFSVCSLGSYSVLLKWYYFYKRADDVSVTDGSVFELDGKTVGVRDDENEAKLVESYLASFDYLFEEDPYDPEYVPLPRPEVRVARYAGTEELAAALAGGEIDLLVDTADFGKGDPSFARTGCFGAFNYFIVTRINEYYQPADSELAQRVTDALDLFMSAEPVFEQTENSELFRRYYGSTGGRMGLTEAEMNYTDSRGTLRIGCLEDFLPYCGSDENGQPSGIVRDVFSEILRVLGLSDRVSCEYVLFSSGADMQSALTEGDIDVMFPYIGNAWDAEEKGISMTVPVMNAAVSVIVKGSYDRNGIRRAAVNGNNSVTELEAKKYYPDAETVRFDDPEACLDAVREGKADGVVMSTLRADMMLKKRRFSSLSAVSLQNVSEVTFAVRRQDTELLGIINRGIYGMEADFAANASYQYMDEMYSYRIWDYINDHLPVILSGLLAVLLVIAAVIVIRTRKNIAKQRRYQAELEEARRHADDANKSKTDFLFTMSHDIRTPMNAIMGFTGMAIKHIDDREKLTDCLDKTQKAGNMLLSLINSVLEVSRIESGHAILEEQPGDVMLSFANIENTMHELADTKDISLTFGFGEIRDRYVYADFSRCMRVFVNVISNAVKYTPAGGHVRVMCEQDGPAKDGRALYRYTVSDDGIGMSEEFQKHVFEQFSREQTTTASGIQGSGLGMSVVKSFVELMGGTVTVQSRQGVGSTFTITLPLRVQEKEEYTDPDTGEVVTTSPVPARQTDIPFTGRRILLVEDNELNMEIATDILQERGLIVETAPDGDVAVAMVQAVIDRGDPRYYDFILMDVQMPRMNGYEATRAIRAISVPNDVHIPIIAMTANAFEEDRRNAISAGMDDHVAKPIDVKKLFDVLAKYL